MGGIKLLANFRNGTATAYFSREEIGYFSVTRHSFHLSGRWVTP
jgi:hypothetical protein